jgi:hypothetical protein
MARSGGRGSLVAVATALALLAAPLPALALFAVNIQAPGGPAAYTGSGITVFDNASGDLAPASNQILLMAGLSPGLPGITGFSFSVGGALSTSPGGLAPPLLSLNWFVQADSAGPNAIQITTSSTGYTLPPTGTASALTSAVSGTFAGATSGSVTAQQWVDLGDNLFATVGPLVTPGPQGPFPSPTPFSNTASVGFTSATPYSMTDRVNLSLGGVGATSAGALSSTVVPEPVTMFLGGTGLLMLTYAARKRLFGR